LLVITFVTGILLTVSPLLAQSDVDLAHSLLHSATPEEISRILDQVPVSALREIFTECRKSAQSRLDHRQHPEALAEFQVTLAVAQRLGSPEAIGAAYRGVGLSHWRLAQAEEALASYRNGLEQAMLAKDQALAAELLRGIGVTERSLGRFADAIDADQQSIAIYHALNNQKLEAAGINNLGANYWRMGDLRRATEYQEQALRLGKAYPEVVDAAMTNLGVDAATQGNYVAARGYFEHSLQYNEAIQDEHAIAMALGNLGPVYRAAGQPGLALATYARALELARSSHDVSMERAILINRAAIQVDNHHPNLAIADLKASVRLGDHGQSLFTTSVALSNLAHLENAAGHSAEALEQAERATAIARQFGSPELLWQALDAVANCQLKLGHRAEARKAFEDSIAQVESWRMQRGGAARDGPDFLADRIAPFHGLLQLLIEDGAAKDALALAEKAKARHLLDVLAQGRVHVAAAMSAGERDEEQRLDAVASDWNRRLAEAGNAAERSAARASWERAAGAADAFRDQFFAAHPELPAKHWDPAPLALAAMDKLLPPASALLEFTVSDDHVYSFLITRGTDGQPCLQTRVARWERDALTGRIDDFRRQLASRDASYRQSAAQIYQSLLGPFDSELKGKATLVIVPDGPLWDLPFQALLTPDGRHLLERQTVFYAPSLTFLNQTLRGARVIANRPQLWAISSSRPADLPYTVTEVSEVARLYSPAKTRILTGEQAAQENWKQEASQYRILHLAGHGVLNSANPLYSYLQFAEQPASGGAILEAREIVNLDLHAEIAVLSACETARGQALYGEGLVGMSWAFLLAGVPTTVVSQWKVDSASTAQLMLTFHQSLKPVLEPPGGLGRARALQQAALAVMRSPEHQHPFYWAGFVLVGNGY
jgi:CHAT domain-containing protein/tetratricopeptide (TPR) repeat protein